MTGYYKLDIYLMTELLDKDGYCVGGLIDNGFQESHKFESLKEVKEFFFRSYKEDYVKSLEYYDNRLEGITTEEDYDSVEGITKYWACYSYYLNKVIVSDIPEEDFKFILK